VLPSKRVTAIQGVAKALADGKWTDACLTLRQFGVTDGYGRNPGSDPYDDIVDALNDAPDEQLTALQEFLFPGVDSASRAAVEDGEIWTESNSFKLFISHTNRYMELAGNLRRALADKGIDAFVAHDQIEPTQQWQDRLETALRTCDALVAIVSPDFSASRWCDQEVGYCMARGVLIVPLSLGADPHGFIGKYQSMSARENDDPSAIAARLADLLFGHRMTAAKMGSVPALQIARAYAESYSFNNARENFERLRAIPKEAWTKELAQIVEKAPESNAQVAHANLYGDPVPELAAGLLDEMLDRGA
jgi:TIR domain